MKDVINHEMCSKSNGRGTESVPMSMSGPINLSLRALFSFHPFLCPLQFVEKSESEKWDEDCYMFVMLFCLLTISISGKKNLHFLGEPFYQELSMSIISGAHVTIYHFLG